MRSLVVAIAVLAAISFTPAPTRANIFGLFGFDCYGPHNHGCRCGSCGNCANGGNCCEPACGCGSDNCCEPACGCGGCCEPACGCGTGCYANGRQYAGQYYRGGCESRVPICPCVGCDGCGQGCGCGTGCGDCCEPACGCNSCGAPCGGGGSSYGSWCGSGTASCPRKCCAKNCGFCSCCGHLISALCCHQSSCGCSGEVYWSEWHNDPPYCHDPCNNCGQWIGPSPGCGPQGGFDGGYGPSGGEYYESTPDGGTTSAPEEVGAQRRPVKPGAPYAQRTPAARTQATNQPRPAYGGQQQNQAAPSRTAVRPPVNRAPAAATNSSQARPIMW